MSEVHRVSVDIGGTEITFETGRMAKQASGSVVVSAGETMVLGTATAGNPRDVDFLPLTVDVEERMYSAGKIPGSFFKREGRSGEKGTLVARMIDRPLRPLFPKGWRRETQLVSIPLSIDHVVPYDILAMNGASAALMVSDIPFPQPVGAVRIGKIDGNFVVNPNEEDLLTADLDLVVAGTDEAILMVEAGANEIPEAEILDALDIAHVGDQEARAPRSASWREGRQGPKLEVEAPQVDEGLLEQIKGSHGAEARRGHLRSRTSSSARTRRRPSRRRSSSSTPATRGRAEYAERRGKAQLAFDKLEKDDHPRAHRGREEAPRRPRARTRSAPITIEVGLAAAHARLRAVHARPDAGAVASPRSARRARRCGSTRSGWRPPSATSTTTTSRPSRSGRPASCAARSAATSATARSPSGRSCR